MITAAWTAAPPMIQGDLTEDDYDDSSEEPEKSEAGRSTAIIEEDTLE